MKNDEIYIETSSGPYTLTMALKMARHLIHGPGAPPKNTPLPGLQEALGAVLYDLAYCNFNWLTGQTARDVLKKAIKQQERK